MFFDKVLEDRCRECGESLELVRDYGISGQVLECKLCGFYVEEIDLRDTTLSTP